MSLPTRSLGDRSIHDDKTTTDALANLPPHLTVPSRYAEALLAWHSKADVSAWRLEGGAAVFAAAGRMYRLDHPVQIVVMLCQLDLADLDSALATVLARAEPVETGAISGNAEVIGDARLSGDVQIRGTARITGRRVK